MRDEQTPKDVSPSFSVVKNLCDLPAITNPFSDFPKHAPETRAKLNILDELVGFLFLERALKSRTVRLRSHGMGQIFDKLGKFERTLNVLTRPFDIFALFSRNFELLSV